MPDKKTILLTNDDGFHARGIKCLYDALSPHYDVTVAAPAVEQSGVGHTFTFMKPLICREACQEVKSYEEGSGLPSFIRAQGRCYSREAASMPGYAISGSPADCVKFAISTLMKKLPDIVISGINDGDNSGVAAFYSGTVAAAREGAFYGIPSFAFSMFNRHNQYMEQYAATAPELIEKILNAQRSPQDARIFYNINFPVCNPADSKGFKVARQSMANYQDFYKRIEDESNPNHGGYNVYGDRNSVEESDEFDTRAVMNGYIAITPLSIDATAHGVMTYLKDSVDWSWS